MRQVIMICFILYGLMALTSAAGKPKNTDAPCKCQCTMHYAPVCATDQKSGDTDTFPNECALGCYNCTHEKNYITTRRGECKPASKRN